MEQIKPKGGRRVRFADSMGMELVSIILFDLINNYYFASIHDHLQKNHAISSGPRLAAPAQPKHLPHSHPKSIRQPYSGQAQASQQSPSLACQQQPAHITTTTTSNINITTNTSGGQIYGATNTSPAITTNNSYYNSTATIKSQQQSGASLARPGQQQQSPHRPPSSYVCEFAQPISLISFKERVKLNKVHLETCSVHLNAPNETISVSCSIRVLNQSFDKAVTLRLTADDWHTHRDIEATYRGAADQTADRFAANFTLSTKLTARLAVERVQFAVRYVTDSAQTYWDNNAGKNYSLRRVNQL